MIMLGVGGLAVATDLPVPPPSIGAIDHQVRAFLAKHCQACHSGAKPKGRFDLKQLVPDFAEKAGRERWRAVLEQVQGGQMPPKEKPRPSAQEIKAVADWISRQVATAEAAQRATQGRVVLRRLNRVEYENTVHDLLGVTLELKEAELRPLGETSTI